MVHYQQIVNRLCRQLGRFVEVVEEIGFSSKISIQLLHAFSSIVATKLRNREKNRTPFRWWPAVWRFWAARWRGVANTTKRQALSCFYLQSEPLGDEIRQVLTPQLLMERVLLRHQKSHRRRRFWRVFGPPAILPISVHPTYIRTWEFNSKRNFTRNVGTHFRCKPWTEFCPRSVPVKR